MLGKASLVEGVFYEFIALPCSKYSMPLGVYRDRSQDRFRVFKGARLLDYLSRASPSRLYLLVPRDPILFYYSLAHELEEKFIEYPTGCPSPKWSLGVWYECLPEFSHKSGHEYHYICSGGLKLLGGEPSGLYSRVYGCFVELLVAYTKHLAGIEVDPSYLGMLVKCIERAGPGRGDLWGIALGLYESLKRGHGEGF